MSDALVIIPTYNEKENIESIIRATFNQEKEFHILIVEGGEYVRQSVWVLLVLRSRGDRTRQDRFAWEYNPCMQLKLLVSAIVPARPHLSYMHSLVQRCYISQS